MLINYCFYYFRLMDEQLDEHLLEFLRPEYYKFMAYYNDQDFQGAANYFLSLIQCTQPHPVAFLDYQLSSFKYFFEVAARPGFPLTFEDFLMLFERFVSAAHFGNLPDMRGKAN